MESLTPAKPYLQIGLGVLWVILEPLIAAGIFSFGFGKVAKLPARTATRKT